MVNSEGIARAVLDLLVDDDLIEVEAHDDAVERLSAALDRAQRDEAVGVITSFLDQDDVIDEIYATDGELESAIRRVLAPPSA
jgi:hypothetical protein